MFTSAPKGHQADLLAYSTHGHVQHTAMRAEFGIEYINTGDRVESWTAIVEHDDGRMEVIQWADVERQVNYHVSGAGQNITNPKTA